MDELSDREIEEKIRLAAHFMKGWDSPAAKEFMRWSREQRELEDKKAGLLPCYRCLNLRRVTDENRRLVACPYCPRIDEDAGDESIARQTMEASSLAEAWRKWTGEVLDLISAEIDIPGLRAAIDPMVEANPDFRRIFEEGKSPKAGLDEFKYWVEERHRGNAHPLVGRGFPDDDR